MKNFTYNKRGFTLVEIVCTIAIIITLATVTTVGVTEHITRSRKAANLVLKNHEELDKVEIEAFDSEGQTLSTPVVQEVPEAEPVSAPGGNHDAIGSSMNASLTSNLAEGASADALAEDPNEEEETVTIPDPVIASRLQQAIDRQPEVYNNTLTTLTDFAAAHNVSYLEGAGNVKEIISACAARAVEQYGNNTQPKFVEVYPCNGNARITSWGLEQRDGQNLTRNVLAASNETAAMYLTDLGIGIGNIRTQLDNEFLTTAKETRDVVLQNNKADTNHVLYFGIYRDENNEVVVVPNICIDTNGNFNVINTYQFTHNNTSESDRSTFVGNRDNYSRNQNGFFDYVNFVTDANGNMLDLSGSPASARVSKDAWVAYVNSLRGSNSTR
jgi:prepilin-type N-terminal cleavage/methylation domain-containing protein